MAYYSQNYAGMLGSALPVTQYHHNHYASSSHHQIPKTRKFTIPPYPPKERSFQSSPPPRYRYLSLVKRRGHALDPVAHFHLHNGASIWRVNWMADTSPIGLQNSYGLMVNYRYNLADISRNSDAYRLTGTTTLSKLIKELL